MMVDPYRRGVYRPVHDERVDTDLEVVGEIPEAIRGVFVQNNPNPRLEPVGRTHWFDGDGMVHGVEMADGRATYRNRWIRTAGLARDLAAGHATTRGIMEPFDPDDPHPDKDTANTDLVWHDGKLLALWWLGGAPHELTVPGLDTVGVEDFGGSLTTGMAAHPKVDPRTGELAFVDLDPYRSPYLRYGVVQGGTVVHELALDLPHPTLFHDLAITEHYTILPDFPMVWDTARLREGTRRTRFEADRPARFGVVARRGTDVRWFEVPPCYCYHTINAWEEGDTLVLQACRIDSPIPAGPQEGAEREIPRLAFLRLAPVLWEWRLDLATGQATGRQLHDRLTEFPRIDSRFLGVRTRWAFCPTLSRAPTLLFDGFLRRDDVQGTVEEHRWGEGCVGGEVVFVPGGPGEGEGWVMTYVQDLAEDRTELRIVDVASLQTVARVRLPRRVPFGFHAHFAPMGAA